MHLCALLLSVGFVFFCQVKPRLRQELVEGRSAMRTGAAIKLFVKPGMCCFMLAEMADAAS